LVEVFKRSKHSWGVAILVWRSTTSWLSSNTRAKSDARYRLYPDPMDQRVLGQITPCLEVLAEKWGPEFMISKVISQIKHSKKIVHEESNVISISQCESMGWQQEKLTGIILEASEEPIDILPVKLVNPMLMGQRNQKVVAEFPK
jgi:hypothetical protein